MGVTRSRTTSVAPWLLAVLASCAGLAPGRGRAADDPAGVEFFEAKVRPLLANRCASCHGEKKAKGGLRLDSRDAVLRGGETGPAAVPEKPADSLIVEAVNYGETVQMPPKSRLPDGEIATLTRWVELGMPWPSGVSAKSVAPDSGFDLKARRAAHWAWRPLSTPTPPSVRDTSWPRDSVDCFILAGLDAKGLTPSPDANRAIFLRRVTFAITGLPPTPAELADFESDTQPDADAKVVDRLLASPRFGERWGRHWLDLVRYGETRGHEFDPPIVNAWRYRDYVIRALNADVSYDQFLTEHLAGDLLANPRLDPTTGANESVLGTGFFLLGEEVHSPVDVRADETDRMDNRLDVTTKTFLGLTVACARCHDHKFDAIRQRDYYALAGFLISSPYRQVRFATMEREKAAARSLQSQRDATRTRVLSLLARSARPSVERLAADLLDARALMTGCSCDARRDGPPADSTRTREWADELADAKNDPNHPFHSFVAKDSKARSQTAGVAAYDLKSVQGRVVVDFGTLEPLERFQNGHAFGMRTAQPGDVIPGNGPNMLMGLVTTAAARRDPAFRHLQTDPRDQREHGRLGAWERAGQTLRTPEFTLHSGRVFYLARGAGRGYASVNSHLLVAGPLHGAVFTEWTEGGKDWRWVHHDLSAYAGHRAHLEFSPVGAADLEIAAVVEADRDPPLREVAKPAGIETPEALARAFQQRFVELLDRLDPDTMGRAGATDDDARLADWLVRRSVLFGGETLKQAIHAEFARLRAAEGSLAREVSGPSPTALALSDGNAIDEHLLIRGSFKTPGPAVPHRSPEALDGDAPIDSTGASGSGRLKLAEAWLAPTNPFTRRVIVNRVWHHLFGRGIVATVDNFGVLGEPPTHPELLDHVADRFVREDWSLKRLVRTLVLTRTYRMDSRPEIEADKLDPQNHLWHRMPVQRLEGEAIRDAMLAVSGRLDENEGGPSVPVHLTAFMQGRGRPGQDGPLDGAGRRSIYLEVRRNFLSPMMLTFDAPIPFSTMGRRNVSNVPAQALILMNDPFVVGQARLWAEKTLAAPVKSAAARVETMYREAFTRPPTLAETADALAFLDAQSRALGSIANDPRAWADLAHMLFNAKAFIFLQ
jgi:Protein of unknown function (DUF1553)/Protein of unknown function (DUF1549)/Planctomycete cytochrome C